MACTASFRPAKRRKKGIKKIALSLIMVALFVNLGLSWFSSDYNCRREINLTNYQSYVKAEIFTLTGSDNFSYGQVVNKNDDAILPFYREDWGTQNVTRFMNPASNDKVYFYGCNNTLITDHSDKNFEAKNNSNIKYLYYGNTLEDYAMNEGLTARGTSYTDGKIGTGFYIPDDYDTDSNYNASSISNNMKVFNFWWKPNGTVDATNSVAEIKTLISIGARDDPRFGIYIYLGVMYGRNVAGGLKCDPQTTTASWTGGIWYNIAWIQNSTSCYFLINNVPDGSVTDDTTGITGAKIGIGAFADDGIATSAKGTIDELYISSAWENHIYNYQYVNYSIGAPENNTVTATDFLTLTYLSPANLNETATHDIIFAIIPKAKEDYVNCSLRINNTIYANTTAIVNNSAVNWTITLANSTYGFNMSCYTTTLYNSTDNYILNVLVPVVPPAILPTASYNLCIGNISYRQHIYSKNSTWYNDTEVEYCDYGCEGGLCNDTPYSAMKNGFYIFILILVAIALILYIGKRV